MKVLIILLVLVTLGFGQTSFEINPKATFDDTVTWVRIGDQVTVNLTLGTAYWQVQGLKVNYVEPDSLGGLIHFRRIITRTVEVPYSGQSITANAQKTATAAKFDLVYTGEQQ